MEEIIHILENIHTRKRNVYFLKIFGNTFYFLIFTLTNFIIFERILIEIFFSSSIISSQVGIILCITLAIITSLIIAFIKRQRYKPSFYTTGYEIDKTYKLHSFILTCYEKTEKGDTDNPFYHLGFIKNKSILSKIIPSTVHPLPNLSQYWRVIFPLIICAILFLYTDTSHVSSSNSTTNELGKNFMAKVMRDKNNITPNTPSLFSHSERIPSKTIPKYVKPLIDSKGEVKLKEETSQILKKLIKNNMRVMIEKSAKWPRDILREYKHIEEATVYKEELYPDELKLMMKYEQNLKSLIKKND